MNWMDTFCYLANPRQHLIELEQLLSPQSNKREIKPSPQYATALPNEQAIGLFLWVM
jgi:hypothetical protein